MKELSQAAKLAKEIDEIFKKHGGKIKEGKKSGSFVKVINNASKKIIN